MDAFYVIHFCFHFISFYFANVSGRIIECTVYAKLCDTSDCFQHQDVLVEVSDRIYLIYR